MKAASNGGSLLVCGREQMKILELKRHVNKPKESYRCDLIRRGSDYIIVKCTGDTICDAEVQVSALDWGDAQTAAIADGAKWLESMLDNRFTRPLPKNADGSYDWVLERLNGLLACIILIRSTDPADMMIESIMNEVMNENENGLLDLLNAGKIKLGFEITRNEAALEEGSITTSTGYPTDLRGTPTVSYEKYKITVGTGGTLATGTKNTTITYTVTDSQGATVVDDELIDGYLQPIGGGMSVRFTPGVYTADDYWFLTVEGMPSNTSVIYNLKVTRR